MTGKKYWANNPIFWSKCMLRGGQIFELLGKKLWGKHACWADTLVGQSCLLGRRACWADTQVGQLEWGRSHLSQDITGSNHSWERWKTEQTEDGMGLDWFGRKRIVIDTYMLKDAHPGREVGLLFFRGTEGDIRKNIAEEKGLGPNIL